MRKQGRNITIFFSLNNDFKKIKTKRKSDERTVFIIHGKDTKFAYELAWILEKNLGLNPIILQEEPDKGKTIIDKFEEYSEVSFAFSIITPDDIGAFSEEKDHLRPRARQNVIFETGYFIGKLGRQRVCCLVKDEIELPSDINGVIYKNFKFSVKECIYDIVKDLIDEGAPLRIFREK